MILAELEGGIAISHDERTEIIRRVEGATAGDIDKAPAIAGALGNRKHIRRIGNEARRERNVEPAIPDDAAAGGKVIVINSGQVAADVKSKVAVGLKLHGTIDVQAAERRVRREQAGVGDNARNRSEEH